MISLNGFHGGCQFVSRNLWHSWNLRPLTHLHLGYAHLEGLAPPDITQADALHRMLRAGRSISMWRKTLYGLTGEKLAVIAKQSSGEVIGLELFYFEARMGVERTLHEAFIGVATPWRSLGLATAMRSLAVRHYALQGVKRLTTDIDPHNTASRHSAINAGFLPDIRATSASRMIRELQ